MENRIKGLKADWDKQLRAERGASRNGTTLPHPGPLPPAARAGEGEAAGAVECDPNGVAQSCTLPYRRVELGQAFGRSERIASSDALQNPILRYGRFGNLRYAWRLCALASWR